ncbi:MAG: hypothetical protein JW806_09995, partial [Sedimentisphaerales bacterium]|nr:hypothetical protein [Sedimentisphaerales bacterium]
AGTVGLTGFPHYGQATPPGGNDFVAIAAGGYHNLALRSSQKYSGGTGEPNDPYQIADVNDLLQLAADTNDYDKCFILVNDIDLAGYTFDKAVIAPDVNDVNIGFQGDCFRGTFDGNGYVISNLIIDANGNDYVGLFGRTIAGCQIKNLDIRDANITGKNYVGSLAGENYGGSITNCYSSGVVKGTVYYAGGMIGYTRSGVANCYSKATVSGASGVGGLIGYGGNITDCYATGTVSGASGVGGLIGYGDGYIINCYATGVVNGDGGGLVGGLYGYISKCYATGDVNGNDANGVGGLVGDMAYSDIVDSYSTGAVSGNDYVGGLIGDGSWGHVTNCYSTGAVSGNSHVGGLTGSGYAVASFWDMETSGQATSTGGTGLTTAEMQEMATYVDAGWDFSYTDGDDADWFIQIDEYPILTWQISPADIYTDGRNDFRDFSVFAQFWLREDCGIYNYYCDWADLDFDGDVDIDDLAILMDYWLEIGIYN